ncbi:MAG: cysteine desulfurase [Candidatus Accumulibacter sp.]|jgi:cysteine desulfurase|nr:cysteine desulfurase [Accumulibacter sp.]
MAATVYFDHNATTPVDPAVLEAMLPWFSERFGNASSRHEYGRAARQAVDEARRQVAAAVGAHATEVVFTSGGSEANNLFIKGAAASLKPGALAVSAVEHPSVIEPAAQLARRGWLLCRLAVDEQGRVDEAAYRQSLLSRPKLVSVMLANNETGVLQDVARLAQAARHCEAVFHTDGVQALGKTPLDFRALNACGVHALTVSAHKLGGPKGVGALVIDKGIELEALVAGGGQERGLRSGTENVAAIVGFGAACELAARRLAERAARLAALRQGLEDGLRAQGAIIFGGEARRLPNTVCFALAGFDGETLITHLDRAGYALASGAACSSAHPEPSHVLKAMGVSDGLARGAVRMSLGTGNTQEQVDAFLIALRDTAAKLRQLTALAVS